jgi:hypothetical protein
MGSANYHTTYSVKLQRTEYVPLGAQVKCQKESKWECLHNLIRQLKSELACQMVVLIIANIADAPNIRASLRYCVHLNHVVKLTAQYLTYEYNSMVKV